MLSKVSKGHLTSRIKSLEKRKAGVSTKFVTIKILIPRDDKKYSFQL